MDDFNKRRIQSIDNLVETLAKSKRAADPKLTMAQARTKVWHEKPELVTAFRLASKQ